MNRPTPCAPRRPEAARVFSSSDSVRADTMPLRRMVWPTAATPLTIAARIACGSADFLAAGGWPWITRTRAATRSSRRMLRSRNTLENTMMSAKTKPPKMINRSFTTGSCG